MSMSVHEIVWHYVAMLDDFIPSYIAIAMYFQALHKLITNSYVCVHASLITHECVAIV